MAARPGSIIRHCGPGDYRIPACFGREFSGGRAMRIPALLSCLLAVALPAVADAPPAAGLDRLAQVMPGTWKTEGQTLDSKFTKAGPQRFTTVRDCWRDADAYKCVY